MSTNKVTSGDYVISLGPFNGTKWEGTLTINGNLNVEGNITSVSDIKVDDAFIVVAANNTGTVQDMGLVAQKTSNTFAGLRFDTVANTWQISSSVTIDGVPIAPYQSLQAGDGVAGLNTYVQYNDNGSFGASANLTFNSSTNSLTLSGQQVFFNTSVPLVTGGATTVYSNVAGAGDTGLYVISSTGNDELISATKARLYSIIF